MMTSKKTPTKSLSILTRPQTNLKEQPIMLKSDLINNRNLNIANKVEIVDLKDKNSLFSNNNNNNNNNYSKPSNFDSTHKALTEAINRANTTNKNLIKMTSNDTSGKNITNNLYNFVDPNKVHLFVKAGQDSRSQGACPFCQDVFMQLLIKADENKFNFDVITINMDNPPKEFKELSIKPPVLFHSIGDGEDPNANVVILSDVDEIAEHLDKLYANKQLSVINQDAKNSFLNVFSKFSHFIRDVTSQASLEVELERINNYLGKCYLDGKKFLCGNYLTKLDCSLLPRLQHIRVASEGIKKYKIPEKFIHLWRYLDNAYKTEAFQKSCPSDREIIWHWSKTNSNTKDFLQILQETPYKTLQIPSNINL